ncbi:hypothetical protein A3K93_03750 [Acinetobacter sp. NCu2D-2]|nr:hypothetical protein A3K93_03750 [Acinetobacter sp. NCu2D-2]
MKKLLITASLIFAGMNFASAQDVVTIKAHVLGELKGRYAIDCGPRHLHDLSYVVADKALTRLISTKRKQGLFKHQVNRQLSVQDGYKYLRTSAYEGFRVDFFAKDGKNWIKVNNTGLINKFGPKTNAYLMQCPTSISYK